MFRENIWKFLDGIFRRKLKIECCDDWYNIVYSPNYLYPLKNHYAENNGETERYTINNDGKFSNNLLNNTINLRKKYQFWLIVINILFIIILINNRSYNLSLYKIINNLSLLVILLYHVFRFG